MEAVVWVLGTRHWGLPSLPCPCMSPTPASSIKGLVHDGNPRIADPEAHSRLLPERHHWADP